MLAVVGICHIPLEVKEAVVGGVQDAEAVGLRLQRHGRVSRAVDEWGIVELFHAGREEGCAGDLWGLTERISFVLPGGRVVQVAVRVVVRVVDRSVLGSVGGGQNQAPYIQRP